jgi:hypothetical protein
VEIHLTMTHTPVAPGQRQTVKIRTGADVRVTIDVTFPSGPGISTTRRAGPDGKLAFSFVQPGNSVTPHSQTATVTAEGQPFIFPGPVAKYQIAYAPMDVAVEPQAFSGDTLRILAHTAARTAVRVQLSTREGAVSVLQGRTGAHGWARFSYAIPAASRSGSLHLAASATVAGRTRSARAAVTLLGPFHGLLYIGCETYTWYNGEWEYLAQVHPGDRMRFGVQYFATDHHITRYPSHVTGTVQLVQSGATVLTLPLLPDVSLDEPHTLATEVTLPATLAAGLLTVQFTATDGVSTASYATDLYVATQGSAGTFP